MFLLDDPRQFEKKPDTVSRWRYLTAYEFPERTHRRAIRTPGLGLWVVLDMRLALPISIVDH